MHLCCSLQLLHPCSKDHTCIYMAGPWTLYLILSSTPQAAHDIQQRGALSDLGSGCDIPGQFLAVVSLALTAVIPTARFVCTATDICTYTSFKLTPSLFKKPSLQFPGLTWVVVIFLFSVIIFLQSLF